MNWDALTEVECLEYSALRRSFWVFKHRDSDPWPPSIPPNIAEAFQAAIVAGHVDPDTYLLTTAGTHRYSQLSAAGSAE